jgi:hypothetical protein
VELVACAYGEGLSAYRGPGRFDPAPHT